MIPSYVEPCGCSYEMTEKPAPDGKGALIDLVIRKCALHENASAVFSAAKGLLTLMDEAGWDLGDESDRVFTQGEFDHLRIAIYKSDPPRCAART